MRSIPKQEKLTSLEFFQVISEGKCLSKLTVSELGIVMDKYVDYCKRDILIKYNLDFYKDIKDVKLRHIENKVNNYLKKLNK